MGSKGWRGRGGGAKFRVSLSPQICFHFLSGGPHMPLSSPREGLQSLRGSLAKTAFGQIVCGRRAGSGGAGSTGPLPARETFRPKRLLFEFVKKEFGPGTCCFFLFLFLYFFVIFLKDFKL